MKRGAQARRCRFTGYLDQFGGWARNGVHELAGHPTAVSAGEFGARACSGGRKQVDTLDHCGEVPTGRHAVLVGDVARVRQARPHARRPSHGAAVPRPVSPVLERGEGGLRRRHRLTQRLPDRRRASAQLRSSIAAQSRDPRAQLDLVRAGRRASRRARRGFRGAGTWARARTPAAGDTPVPRSRSDGGAAGGAPAPLLCGRRRPWGRSHLSRSSRP
jgi:hypothetical protein